MIRLSDAQKKLVLEICELVYLLTDTELCEIRQALREHREQVQNVLSETGMYVSSGVFLAPGNASRTNRAISDLAALLDRVCLKFEEYQTHD